MVPGLQLGGFEASQAAVSTEERGETMAFVSVTHNLQIHQNVINFIYREYWHTHQDMIFIVKCNGNWSTGPKTATEHDAIITILVKIKVATVL